MTIKIEKINYRGWEDCLRLSDDKLNLVVTTQVGPRIISLATRDGKNLLNEVEQDLGTRGGEEWKLYGGHRFWCAPESKEFTYAPDNFPVEYHFTENSVILTAPVEKTGVQKVIQVSLVENMNSVNLVHTVVNRGTLPLTLAPWALTVMTRGGTAIIPHNLGLPAELLPTHSLSLWGYTRLEDPRWSWGNRYILLDQDPNRQDPQKIGLRNQYRWAAYAVDNQLFVKKFAFDAQSNFPDYGCNFETYTNADILELESLAPLVTLAPGESTTHQETWEIYSGIPAPRCDADVDAWILPLIG